jgi:hypothetical protein
MKHALPVRIPLRRFRYGAQETQRMGAKALAAFQPSVTAFCPAWQRLEGLLAGECQISVSSLADIASRPRHARYSPQSGHISAVRTSALCQKQTWLPVDVGGI